MITFDSSTLILIAKADLLEIFLASTNQTVTITQIIEKECLAKPLAIDALMIQKAIQEKKITIKALKDKKLSKKLQTDFPLGDGEAEALAHALSEKAKLAGIDDKAGINACKLLRIPFTNAVALLVRAHEKKLITTKDAKVKLDVLARYGRYKATIIEDASMKLEGK